MSRRLLLNKIYRTVAALVVLILALLVSIVFLNPTSVGNPDFVGNINLWAVIWAATFVFFLVLSFILARDLVKLFFDYQARRPGSRIKGKLIATFIVFSLFPALVMSFLAFGLINRNLQLWFTSPTEQILTSSERIVSRFYEQGRQLALSEIRSAGSRVIQGDESSSLQRIVQEGPFQALLLFDSSGGPVAQAGQWLGSQDRPAHLQNQALERGDWFERSRLFDMGRADTDIIEVALRIEGSEEQRILVGQLVDSPSVEFHAIQVEDARSRFQELQASVDQIRINYFSILALTTLAIIFGFVWLGTYIARRITVPLEAVAVGARALADGDLDHRVAVEAVDELGILVDSFNRMAQQIEESRSKLERANLELIAKNGELEERRRHTDTILQNIATGVISVDESDRICTVNQAVLRMFETTLEEILDHPVEDLAGPELQQEFQILKRRAALYGTFRKDISFRRGERQLYIAATATANPLPLRDEPEYLIVLDDLTELIKAEKFAAWQEVARRLAHEIKNPLTPIQLSAERILKRFQQLATDETTELRDYGRVVDEAVHVIESEASALKNLVNEFSRFARLPISKPVQCNLHELIESTLTSFNGALEAVRIDRDFDPALHSLPLDPEQFRRVLVNLIDNSLDSLAETRGDRLISIQTVHESKRGIATIEFSDNGPGMKPDDYEQLFLPYFSIKKKGTGLGLAIVRQIINEHQGYVRAEPNAPTGMRFVIGLPLQ